MRLKTTLAELILFIMLIIVSSYMGLIIHEASQLEKKSSIEYKGDYNE